MPMKFFTAHVEWKPEKIQTTIQNFLIVAGVIKLIWIVLLYHFKPNIFDHWLHWQKSVSIYLFIYFFVVEWWMKIHHTPFLFFSFILEKEKNVVRFFENFVSILYWLIELPWCVLFHGMIIFNFLMCWPYFWKRLTHLILEGQIADCPHSWSNKSGNCES